MPQVFANGARVELDTSISAEDISLNVISGGEMFPIANYEGVGTLPQTSPEDWFKLVIQDDDGFEVVYCYSHTVGSNIFNNLRRGMDGTTARAFSTGAVVGIRPLAKDMGDLVARTKANSDLLETKADIAGNIQGNAATATKLESPRALSISGGVTASAKNFDGTMPVDLVVTAIDVSKANQGTLPVARGGTGAATLASGQVLVGNGTGAVATRAIDTTTGGTQSSTSLITSGAVNAGLALKANTASPVFTGTPAAPTAAPGTNTTQLATTGFVQVGLSGKSNTDHTHGNATTSSNGFMSSSDKTKLDGIETGANKFSLPAGTNGQVLKHNGTTWVAGTDNNTTYSVVTTSVNGLMSASDKTKLDGIETGANNFSLPAGTNGQVLKHNGTTWVAGADADTTYGSMSATEANAGTATTGRVITAAVLKSAINTHAPAQTSITGNAGSATKLATARTINGVAFDGTANITVEDTTKLPLSGGTLTGSLEGKAISGELTHSSGYFQIKPYGTTYDDGSTMRAYWDGNSGKLVFSKSGGTGLSGVRLQANLIGNADTATSSTKLTTARSLSIGSTAKNFDGSDNVSWSVAEILPTGTNGQVLKHNGTTWVAGTDNNTSYSTMSASEANTGTATSARVITAAVLKGAINAHAPVQTTITGNAGTATKLATARTINGTAFDGSANITTANWGTARNISIGGVAKSVNGSANVTWTADEVGSVKSFTSVPTTNQGLQIVVTTPHIRFMVWNGTKYVRAPWHAPGQLSYFLRNIPTGYVEVRSDVVLNKADFPDLAEYLGVSATTFTLDETRGEFLRALDSGRGKDSGRAVGSHQGDAGRNLTGGWYPSNEYEGAALGSVGIYSGVFAPSGVSAPAKVQHEGSLPAGSSFGLDFDASRQWPVANEFRVTNRAYRLAVQY